MKKLLICALLVLSVNLFAQEKSLIYTTLTSPALNYTVGFNVNKDLGRAWAVITKIDNSYEETIEIEKRVKIEGLSYDESSNEIIHTALDGTITTCAYVRSTKRSVKISNSGNCRINQETSTDVQDDGFTTKTVLRANFFLNI